MYRERSSSARNIILKLKSYVMSSYTELAGRKNTFKSV